VANSKFAVHYQTKPEWKADKNDSVNIVARSNMEWVKVMDADQLGGSPFNGKRILARLWIETQGKRGDQWEKEFYMAGAAGARLYFAMLQPRYDKLISLGILDVEGPNEPNSERGHNDSPVEYINDWKIISEFFYEWARLCIAYGLKPWVFSNSTGTPEFEVLVYMANSILLASKAGGGWSLHEYSAPCVLRDVGWHRMRVVRALETLARVGIPRGTLRVWVSEGGIDGGIINWNKPPWNTQRVKIGWKDWSGYAYTGAECFGLLSPQGGMTEELFWRNIDRQDADYLSVDEIVAFSPFTTNPDSKWYPFVVTSEVVGRMADKHGGNSKEPLPEDEMSRDPQIIAQKCRWWMEQEQREREQGNAVRANKIRLSLIQLLYKLENML